MGFNQAPALPYSKLGIVEDGDTASRAISKDAYVIWKGGNYFAKTDILQGATFVVDTNLTAIPDGVVNGIVSSLNSKASWTKILETTKGDTAVHQIDLTGKHEVLFICKSDWLSAHGGRMYSGMLLVETIPSTAIAFMLTGGMHVGSSNQGASCVIKISTTSVQLFELNGDGSSQASGAVLRVFVR